MNSNTFRFGIAAVAFIALAFLGWRYLPGGGTGGGPDATPTPTPTRAASPSVSATPPSLPNGALAAGDYVLHPLLPPNHHISVTVTVPDGWEGFNGNGLLPITGAAGPDGMGIGFNTVTRLYSDPCRAITPDSPVGPSVDDLARAFGEQTAYQVTDLGEVEIDGYSGTQLSLLMPSDVDFGTCGNGGFYVWEGSIYAQGPGNRWDLTILDVEGTRLVILAQTNPETSSEDRGELQGILDSIRIDAPSS